MADVFVSYARLDEARPSASPMHFGTKASASGAMTSFAHRPYADVIQERLGDSRAVSCFGHLMRPSRNGFGPRRPRPDKPALSCKRRSTGRRRQCHQPNPVRRLAGWDGSTHANGWNKLGEHHGSC